MRNQDGSWEAPFNPYKWGDVPDDRILTVEAENNGPDNVYIQSVTLNGVIHDIACFTREALAQAARSSS